MSVQGVAVSFCAALVANRGLLCAQSCSLSRASAYSNWTQFAVDSAAAGMSSDGRFVSFYTAEPAVPQDTNGFNDIYLVDTTTGAIGLVSIGTGGVLSDWNTQMPSDVSGDGRFVCFTSVATTFGYSWPLQYRGYVRDRLLGQTRLVSTNSSGVDGHSFGPMCISANGRYVAFLSMTGALSPVPDNNGTMDVLVHDIQTGAAELASISINGTAGNNTTWFITTLDMSDDGRYVVFADLASDLVLGDTNGYQDVFRRDRVAGVTERISISSAGQPANEHSMDPACSADGRFVSFMSRASNLVPADSNGVIDIFVRDLQAGTIERVSVDSSGVQSNGYSTQAAVSPDGRFAAFKSAGTNLVPGDTNAVEDVFLHDRLTGRTDRVSITSIGQQTSTFSGGPHLSTNAGKVVFETSAALTASDTNNAWDIYCRFGDVHSPICPPLVDSYCTAGTTSHGCVPIVDSVGVPSISSGVGFAITIAPVEGQRAGLIFYALDSPGWTPLPWATGSSSYLCVKPPTQRTSPQMSGGTVDVCDGVLSEDWNAFIAATPFALGAPFLGQRFCAQAWFRDPPSPKGTMLSDALTYMVLP